MATQKEFIAKVVLMVGVALDELGMVEAEPDLAKTRLGISSAKSTLTELLNAAGKQAEEARRVR
jgi:hypothetical protein